MTLKGDRAEIEKLVDKVIEENLDTVKSFKYPRRREFAHCILGGMIYNYLYFLTFDINLIGHLFCIKYEIKQHFLYSFLEGKKKVDKDLLSKILYEKLFATLKQPTGKIMLFIFVLGFVIYIIVTV